MKRDFITRKVKKMEKDKKYGFKLSEMDQKITKKHYGDLVDRLKQHKQNLVKPKDEFEPEFKHECNFCQQNKLQEWRIPMDKMKRLFYDDFVKCKHDHQISQIEQEEEENHGQRRRALEKYAEEIDK